VITGPIRHKQNGTLRYEVLNRHGNVARYSQIEIGVKCTISYDYNQAIGCDKQRTTGKQLQDQGNQLRLLENTMITITFRMNVIDFDYI